MATQTQAAEPVRLSEIERVIDTYVEPNKTFKDIRRSASWWLPYVLSVIVGLGFAYAIDRGVGFDKVAEANIARSQSAQDRLNAAGPAQRAQSMRMIATTTKVFTYGFPALTLIFALISAAVLMATFKFGLGGEGSYKQYFAVWMYASLPYLIKYVLAIIAIFAGLGGEGFNIQNPVGTNVGFYLSSDFPQWVRTLFSSADIFTIWVVILLVIGCATIARVKRSSAAFVVVGWWVLAIIAFTVSAAFQG